MSLEMSDKIIKLKSSDGQIFEATLKSATMSHTIKDMLEACLDETTEIPLPNVTSATLKRVVEWTEHWKDSPQPTCEEIKDKLAEKIDMWDENFLRKMELTELYDLVS